MLLGVPLSRELDETAPRGTRPASAPAGGLGLGFEPIATSLGHLIPGNAEDAPADEGPVGALVGPAATGVVALEGMEGADGASLGMDDAAGAAVATIAQDAGGALPQRAAL